MVRMLGSLLLAVAVVSSCAPESNAGWCGDPADVCGTAYANCSVYTCIEYFGATCGCAKYRGSNTCSCS